MEEGYPKLASRMADVPDLAIFRRFQSLNLQNLLYLQAELVYLEEELQTQAAADAQSGSDTRKLHSRDWYRLSHSHEFNDGDRSQWEIIRAIRPILKEYNEALAQEAFIAQLQKPRSHHLQILRECLDDPKLSDYLLGKDCTVWSDERTVPDLISAHPVHKFDHMSLWLIKLLLPIFHRFIGRQRKGDGPVHHYEDGHLERPASVVSTVLASLLPVAAIVVLYYVTNMAARLGIIAAFTAIFSFVLALISTGRRVEVFTATAAFAAVQVVFISASNNSS